MRVAAVGVALADLAVLAVDQQLGLLVARDLAAGVDCLALGVVDGRQPSVARAADAPLVPRRNDVRFFPNPLLRLASSVRPQGDATVGL
jgi:hypothetical protein